MDKDILLDGKTLISAKRASEKFGYSQDYIGQLARGGHIDAKLIGRTWFVDAEALRGHKKSKSSRKKDPVETQEEPSAPQVLRAESRYEAESLPLLPELAKRPVRGPWDFRKEVVAETVLAFSLVAIISASGIFGLNNFSPALADTMLDKLSRISLYEQKLLATVFDFLPSKPIKGIAFFDGVKNIFKKNPASFAAVNLASGQNAPAVYASFSDLESMRESLRQEFAAYANPRLYPILAYQGDIRELDREAPATVVNNIYQTISRQSESDVELLNRVVDELESNGVFDNSILTNAAISGSTFTGSLASSTELLFGNATGTSATTTNFFATNALFTNLITTGQTITDLIFTSATGTSATTTNFFATNASTTDIRSNTGFIGMLTSTFGSFRDLLVNGSSTLQDMTFQNATGTSATTTNLFVSGLASTTNFRANTGLFGNVGIGTTTPQSRLYVSASTLSGIGQYNTGAIATFERNSDGWLNILTPASNQGGILFGDVGGTDRGFLIYDHSADALRLGTVSTEQMRITSTGNVGIGTTTPQRKLEIKDSGATLRLSDSQDGVWNIGDRMGGFELYSSDAGQNQVMLAIEGKHWRSNGSGHGDPTPAMTFSVGDVSTYALTERMRINPNGNVGIGVTSPPFKLSILSANDSTFTSSDLVFTNDASGNYRNSIANAQSAGVAASNKMAFRVGDGTTTGQTTVMTLTGAGNVGIGVTDPGYPIDVLGRGRVRGADNNGGGWWFSKSGTPTTDTSFIGRPSVADGDDFTGFYSTAALWNLVVKDTGNVGIGTTTPNNKLEVIGGNANTITIGRNTDTGLSVGDYQQLLFSSRVQQDYTTAIRSIQTVASGVGDYLKPRLGFFTSETSGDMAEKMSILHNGNVGIGTTTPDTKLTLVAANTNSPAISIGRFGNPSYKVGIGEVFDGTNGAGIQFYAADALAGPLTSSNVVMSAYRSGNVGIGTTTPADKLVIGDTSSGGNLRLYSSSYGNNGIARFYGTDGGEKMQIGALGNAESYIYTPASTDLSIYTGGSEKIRINSSGNVGIGTTTPGARLEVKGTGTGSFMAGAWGGDASYGALSVNGNITLGANLYSPYGGSTLYINRPTGGNINFREANGSDQLTIESGGNVGIGISDPSTVLATKSGALTVGAEANDKSVLQGGTGFGALLRLYSGSGTETVRFDAGGGGGTNWITGGNLGIGTNQPGARLDIASGDQTGAILIGADVDLATRTNATRKLARIVGKHYTNSEENISMILLDADSTTSTIQVGGGGAALNAATRINFLTAADTTTTSGTTRLTIDSSGNVGIGTSTPGSALAIKSTTIGFNHIKLMNDSTDNEIVRITDCGTGLDSGIIQLKDGGTTKVNLVGDDDNVSCGYTYFNAGHVGIGTTQPAGRLTVVNTTGGTTPANYLQIAGSIVDNSNFPGIEFKGGTGPSSYARIAINNSGVGLSIVGASHPTNYTQAQSIFMFNGGAAAGADAYTDIKTNETVVARFRSDGFVGINMTNPSVALDVTGDIEYTGSITDVSDSRLKENVVNITDALSLIRALRATSFNMIGSDKRDYGFIAQEVQVVLPDAVHVIDPETGYLGVSYLDFIPFLAQGVKELDLLQASTTLSLAFLTTALNDQGLEIDQLQSDVAELMNIASTTLAMVGSQETRLSALESLVATSGAFTVSTSTPGFLASVINAVESTVFALLSSREVRTDRLCVEDVCVTRERFLEIVGGGSPAPVTSGGDSSSEPIEEPEPTPDTASSTPEAVIESEPPVEETPAEPVEEEIVEEPASESDTASEEAPTESTS